MRVLITGGTGFIGWALNIYRAYEPNQLLVPGAGPMIGITRLNHADYDNQKWEARRWDAIIHLAHADPGRVIRCARAFHIPVLMASSGAVYHDKPTDYGLEKIAWETKLLKSGIDCRIARIFTTCGPHMNWGAFAIGNFIRDAAQGGPIRILGNGETQRTYLYAKDLAAWLWAILWYGERGGIYDVGSTQSVTILDLACEVQNNFYPEPDIIIENKIAHEQAPVYFPYHAYETMDKLDVNITVPFPEAVKRTVTDYLREEL